MAEISYYHLTRSKVEDALPIMLEKSVERKYRVVVQVGSQERCEAIDALLWTHKEDSFLAHGAEGADDNPQEQPIWITPNDDNPNDANVLFLIDNANVNNPEQYQRVIRMFDGHDTDAVTKARELWKQEQDSGHKLEYLQQDDNGKWVNKTPDSTTKK